MSIHFSLLSFNVDSLTAFTLACEGLRRVCYKRFGGAGRQRAMTCLRSRSGWRNHQPADAAVKAVLLLLLPTITDPPQLYDVSPASIKRRCLHLLLSPVANEFYIYHLRASSKRLIRLATCTTLLRTFESFESRLLDRHSAFTLPSLPTPTAT